MSPVRAIGAAARRLWSWRSSMFAQMALLTLIFLGWGLYVFVIRPIADIPDVQQVRPPLQLTEERLRSVLHQFTITRRDHPDDASDPGADPLVRAIVRANPDFRFHARVGDRAFGNGAPVTFRRLGLERLVAVQRALNNPEICSQTTKIAEDATGHGYAEFYMCDVLTYFEYRGLAHPVVSEPTDDEGIGRKWFVAFSGNFLLAAGGMFLIFALIFTLHILSIRRVATLARSIDPQRLDATLPEKGVATEILPLVRAVNHLIGQVDAGQRRSTFFLSAAAHEMRTPLTVLRTRLELMDEGEQKEKLIGDVGRLTRLVNQLLTLMSIGNRRDVTGFADLVATARKAVADLSLLAASADVALAFESEVAALEVPGDQAMIGSAIVNLIDNAISFAPAGTRVAVRVRADGAVEVRDHGPGLGGVDPESLFEPFVRPVSSRRGYGMGLAIVRAIVRLHGGEATGANADGGGAIFTATFSSQSPN